VASAHSTNSQLSVVWQSDTYPAAVFRLVNPSILLARISFTTVWIITGHGSLAELIFGSRRLPNAHKATRGVDLVTNGAQWSDDETIKQRAIQIKPTHY